MLVVWLRALLAEQKLDAAHVYSVTSDSGSDVKRLLSVLVRCEWAWCMPQMAGSALAEAVGADGGSAESPDDQARGVIGCVKIVVERCVESAKAGARWKELRVSCAVERRGGYPAFL